MSFFNSGGFALVHTSGEVAARALGVGVGSTQTKADHWDYRYHKVSQTGCAEEGICVAVNYWYDMEFSGPLYCLDTLVRSVDGKRKAEEKKNGGG